MFLLCPADSEIEGEERKEGRERGRKRERETRRERERARERELAGAFISFQILQSVNVVVVVVFRCVRLNKSVNYYSGCKFVSYGVSRCESMSISVQVTVPRARNS